MDIANKQSKQFKFVLSGYFWWNCKNVKMQFNTFFPKIKGKIYLQLHINKVIVGYI